MLPQMRELVNKYEPWVLWTDGQWDLSSKAWHSRPFVSWLYNESPVANKVVINGRWGKDMEPKKGPFLGNFISTENDGVEALQGPWEECRGLGYSFGYNRNEDISDYNTSQTLILLLVDIVSHGGNLLLDIGPDERGEIPQIMRDRLTEMGAWLKINGESIYGTRKWIEPVQWSEGRRTSGVVYKKEKKLAYLGGDFILKQTVNPDPGDAVKEVFFTTKGETIYAILPTWGKNGVVNLRNINMEGRKVSLLETGDILTTIETKDGVNIKLPVLDTSRIKSKNAYVLKIS
jgi:alpha-L-fucosidase